MKILNTNLSHIEEISYRFNQFTVMCCFPVDNYVNYTNEGRGRHCHGRMMMDRRQKEKRPRLEEPSDFPLVKRRICSHAWLYNVTFLLMANKTKKQKQM